MFFAIATNHWYDVSEYLQIEAEKSQQSKSGGKATLGSIGKSNSVDGKISRSSLIRAGSQEDPQQLMRDLQDSIEREADIREQLKFAEEEAESLRTKVLRIEDENESLMVQVKKMATKARSKFRISLLKYFVPLCIYDLTFLV